MRKIAYRLYQKMFKLMSYVIPFKSPKIITKMNELPKYIKGNTLLITDKGIKKAGLLDSLEKVLEKNNINYTVFDGVLPNPSIDVIESAYTKIKDKNITTLIALGGGSVIDATKAVGIRIVKPKKPLEKFRGVLKVRKKIPNFIAIPTTAGSGSEATLASVVSNPEKQEKYAINDPSLFADVTLHDPTLLVNLPSHITASTGMDVLTHAVEAFIGKSNTKQTKKDALNAILGVKMHLDKSYKNPENLDARSGMLHASYLAGRAFTRAYVGNIHALAHPLSAFYDIPHGKANAVIMPHVLRYYGAKIHKKLAVISDYIKLTPVEKSHQFKSEAFIHWIDTLNKTMKLPAYLDVDDLNSIDKMCKHALKEANPLYPVPVIFSYKDFYTLYETVLKTTK